MVEAIIDGFKENGWNFVFYRVNPSHDNIYEIMQRTRDLEMKGHEIIVAAYDYLAMADLEGTQGESRSDKLQDLYRRARNFFTSRGAAFFTPHQLNPDAKKFIRESDDDSEIYFAREVGGKSMTEGSTKLTNEVDVELTFHVAKMSNDECFFTAYVGKQRGEGSPEFNPLPGYGFNTDPYPEPIMENRYGNMGRFYKRIHHDNAEMVTLTACVPEFTGILPFLMNMFDYSAAVMVNKGRAPGWAFYIGQAAGAIAFFPAQIVAASWNFFEYLTQQPKNQWYYGKPAMGQYLTAAQGMFNDLMVAAGYTLTVLPQGSQVMDTKLGDRQSNGLKGYRTHSDQAKILPERTMLLPSSSQLLL
ncbi:putative virion structural protein [Aeromonas phage AP1]|nr:putative virion structural protein [Aeromonas phage AP1]